MSQRLGSPFLKIGTVLLILSLLGKTPDSKLRLKMWANGILTSLRTNLSSLRLIPSMSKLCLLGNDLIMSDTCQELMSDVGKVTLKSNVDEALSDEFLLKNNGDEALNDGFP